MSTLRLESLFIQGFRSFEQMSIDRLGRVNLCVGKNSVGKTALLEALWLYSDGGGIHRLRRILMMRDELGNVTPEGAAALEALRYLFYGRPKITGGEVSATIGDAIHAANRLRISIRPIDAGSIAGTGVLHEPLPSYNIGANSEYFGFSLNTAFGTERPVVIPITQVHNIFGRDHEYSSPVAVPSAFITPNGLSRAQIGHLWDRVALTDLEEIVLSALRIVVPKVERISIVNTSYSGSGPNAGRVPIVKIKGERVPVPLRSLGEGLYRLFGLALALVDAAKGFFLVDEIESGLHYSVQVDLWRIIFTVARQLDIQVFATTHSFDCIEAFQAAAQEDGTSEGMLIRLERKDGVIVPTLFDERRLGIVTREHIEVR